jgi:hypothetical protein
MLGIAGNGTIKKYASSGMIKPSMLTGTPRVSGEDPKRLT